MDESINGDLSVRVRVDSRAMTWTPSPSGTVWRKRLHLVGPAESGQVTSVVRYEPDARFPAHDHPGGEEILVLEGVFSDEQGDWPAGTFLLNPEGFRHAPFSREGCLLFVKLRQFPGRDRRHVAVDAGSLSWQRGDTRGVCVKPLYAQAGFSDVVRLERWDPGSTPGARSYANGVEFFVIEGRFEDEQGACPAGTWLRLPPGTRHQPRTSQGCTLYLKEGGFPYLQAATP